MILVVMTFVAREVETLRSIFQIRYASNPGNIQVDMRIRHRAEACLPELNKFAASVNAQNTPMHSIVTSADMIPVLLVCESP
jgi:hypothetical protein